MYTVVSRWEALPGKWDQFEAVGRKMRQAIRSWPGVESVQGVQIGGDALLAIIGYKSEADYQRLIQDPEGPFEKAGKENGIENVARWVWSERGESMD
jgi:hypothetical protein